MNNPREEETRFVPQSTKSTQVHSEQELRRKFYHRLCLAKTYAGRSNAEIARRTRSSESTVGSWFDPKVKAMPDGIKMLQLPFALGVNGHWLVTGEGPMVQQDGHQQVRGAREAIARTQVFLDELRIHTQPPADGDGHAPASDRRHEA